MRTFFFKILLSLAPLIALYLVDFIYSQVAMQSNYEPFESWYELMHGKIDADVVIIGNSHAYNYYDPYVLDSTLNINSFNLGQPGQNIYEFIPRYDLYRQLNNKPDLIIQDINLFTLYYRYGNHKEQYFPYFWNKSMRNAYYSIEPLSFQEKYLPLYRYHGYNLWFKREPRYQYKGFTPLNQKYDGTGLASIDSLYFKYDGLADSLFDNYLACIKSDSIKMILVYTPIYIEAVKKHANIDEMYAYYQKYADKYDIPILDYNFMGICYDSTFFANSTHINRIGAKIFSDSLANDIKRLGLLTEK